METRANIFRFHSTVICIQLHPSERTSTTKGNTESHEQAHATWRYYYSKTRQRIRHSYYTGAPNGFVTRGLISSYCFRRAKYVVSLECKIRSASNFSYSHQQLGNLAGRILFPKKFQLKTPNRSICTSLHKYAFKRLWNNLRKQKMIFQVFC